MHVFDDGPITVPFLPKFGVTDEEDLDHTIRLYTATRRITPSTAGSTGLFTQALRYICLDALKEEYRHWLGRDGAVEVAPAETDPEVYTAVREALETMTDGDRRLISLALAGFDVQECAKRCDLTNRRAKRGIKLLRRSLMRRI